MSSLVKTHDGVSGFLSPSSLTYNDGLQVAAINAAMSSLVKTLNVFPKERTIVQRERAKVPP